MTIAYRLDGALLPFQSVRLQGNDGTNNAFPSFATMGEPGIAQVRIEDPSGVLDIDGWHTFTVEESACSKPRIFTGWIMGRAISRGPYRTGAGRVWQCEIIDQNALFGFEVFRSTAASVRPAETDVARISAAIVSHAMAGTPIHDNGRFSTANPLALAAGNFVAQTPAEMFGSTAGQCAKNFYAYWDDSAQQISLHYDAVGAGPAAGISISNVASDVTSGSGGTCYPPFIDAELSKDPSPLYTGVLLHWTGGYVYDRNSTVINDLSPSEFSPTNFLRDYVIDSDRIGKASTAASQLQKQLLIHSVESESLTCTVQVAARDVNLCNAGDVINVRFSHIPGYTTSTAVAITRRTVEPVDGMDSIYNVTLELANTGTSRGTGGGGVGGLPLPNCIPSFVQEIDGVDTSSNWAGSGISLPATPVPGNVLICWIILRDISGTQTLVPTGFTATGTSWQADPASGGGHKNMGCRMFYRFVVAGDTKDIALTRTGSSEYAYIHISEWNGVDQFDGLSTWTSDEDISTDPMVFGSATVTPLANRSTLFVSGFQPSLNVNDQWHPKAANISAIELGASGVGDAGGAGGNAAKSNLLYRVAAPVAVPSPVVLTMAASPASGISRGFATLTVAFSGTCTDTPPAPGQPVNGEQPTPSPGGGTTTFTTTNPYAEGSLKVYVDGIRQPVIETNPATGEYQLYFDPRTSEYVFEEYQARTGGE